MLSVCSEHTVTYPDPQYYHRNDLGHRRAESCHGTKTATFVHVAFMLQRSTGGIPVSKERALLPEVAKAQEKLKSIQTSSSYLIDVTDLGKTDTALGSASPYALYGDYSDSHRPMLVVMPYARQS